MSGLPPWTSNRFCGCILCMIQSSAPEYSFWHNRGKRQNLKLLVKVSHPNGLNREDLWKIYLPVTSPFEKLRPPGFYVLISTAFALNQTFTSSKLVIIMPSKILLQNASDSIFYSFVATHSYRNPRQLLHCIEIVCGNHTRIFVCWIGFKPENLLGKAIYCFMNKNAKVS